MLVIRCKSCNSELRDTTKHQVCGCPNQTSIVNGTISALDLTKVVIVDDGVVRETTLSNQDLEYQEKRRKRKVRKLDFEER